MRLWLLYNKCETSSVFTCFFFGFFLRNDNLSWRMYTEDMCKLKKPCCQVKVSKYAETHACILLKYYIHSNTKGIGFPLLI